MRGEKLWRINAGCSFFRRDHVMRVFGRMCWNCAQHGSCGCAHSQRFQNITPGNRHKVCLYLLFAYLLTTASGAQKGSSAGTKFTGTSLTKPFSQRAHSSIPACSEGICPRMISALCLTSFTASATYSTVSHSRVSPSTSTSTLGSSKAYASHAKPDAPG